MKTKEEILKDLADPIREAVLSAITPIISNAMTMYSDQQNKELREELQSLIKELDEVKTSHYQKLDAQLVEDVERLTEENKELREWKKEQLEVWGPVADYLMTRKDIRLGERMSVRAIEILKNQDAEIQRLTKEVEELKLKLSGKTFFNPFDQENTHLRELLEKIMAYFDDGTIVRDTSRDGDSDFHERMISFVKLLTEIDNALNHKP